MITIPTHILQRKDVYSSGKMVLAVIEAYPDRTYRQIAGILCMSPYTVKETIGSLHERGLVTMKGKGKTFTYRINHD